ncbi:class I SAM-dependent methyltransferase [Streptomyces sp. V2I9]|uniref:class I SAM-dependent methyltransferase n=1 Tax=Streptomyces sp. V2I9 TaxID=3042304 RepID=UPI0027D8669D|nr:class I SAM-dependent methyltransferase [Streptomyces sp. V2I9]
MANPVRARSFDAVAAACDAHRPSCPPALFDAVEELAGLPLAGARVADVGAGTGLGTARLYGRGAEVTAVEPGDGMAGQFRRSLPDVSLVRGDGNSLPLRTGSMDLITYAQSWHWADPARSVPEARRVLREGGALALWWNDGDPAVEWLVGQEDRMRAFFGVEAPAVPSHEARFRAALPDGLDSRTRRVAWSRRVPIERHIANLAAYSDFLTGDPVAVRSFLDRERAVLEALFPGGEVEEAYVVSLAVAHR